MTFSNFRFFDFSTFRFFDFFLVFFFLDSVGSEPRKLDAHDLGTAMELSPVLRSARSGESAPAVSAAEDAHGARSLFRLGSRVQSGAKWQELGCHLAIWP